MTAMFEHPSPAACPACVVAPAAGHLAHRPSGAVGGGQIMLSLPNIHCAGCIAGVERALHAAPGVKKARVNLTLRRVVVDTDPTITAADLTQILAKAGYGAHELDPTTLAMTDLDHRGKDVLMRLAVAFFAMMNVMLLSVAVWAGAEGATRDMMHWISAAIAIPAVIFCGKPFYASAFDALKAGRLNMDVPITFAIVLAVVTSVYETMQSGEHAYFDAAITLCCFLLAGRYLDHRARAQARSAAQELAALELPRATRITKDGPSIVMVTDLAPGDIVGVKPGGRIPVDGIVQSGQSEIDRSLMTGESLPAYIAPGATVNAGEVNLTGPLHIKTTAAGQDTALHRIADLVAMAEAGRNNYTSLADKAAKLYAPGVHILSALAAVGWFIYTNDIRVALNIAAAVLIITCPCALGLAVPAVTAAASGRLFRKGLLIKDSTAMERLAEIDTVVFDKTGTLTHGLPIPLDLDQLNGDQARVALALANGSAHPLAAAIAKAMQAKGIEPAPMDHLHEVPGFGIQGIWNGQTARLGRAAWVGANAPERTATTLKIGDEPAITLTFHDDMRAGAADLVTALKAQGKHVILISGDTEASVHHFAKRIGIDTVFANALPHEKADKLTDIAAKGGTALMVGDGLNDTAALAAAHVSISPASALAAARAASDMVLMGQSLAPIADAITTSQSAKRRIQENFSIATMYNILAVPFAIAGLCSPLIAALAMSSSSITVSLNALRLK